MSHRFLVGQVVDLAYRMLQTAPTGQIKSVSSCRRPTADATIRAIASRARSEKYERVAAESDLTLVSVQAAVA